MSSSLKNRSLVLAVLVAGCVHSRVTGFDPAAASSRRTPPERIRFYEITQPKCAFREIGHVAVNPRFLTSWSRVVDKARDKASELGGDAIVRLNERTRISGVEVTPTSISTTETTTLSGTVVRFTDYSCRD